MLNWIFQIVAVILDQACHVLMYPFDPSNRIYWLYLVSSAIVSFFVYRSIKAKAEHHTPFDIESASGSYLQFLFPKSVWSHPSAWLDLRYMLFHRTLEAILLLGVKGLVTAFSYRLASGGQSFTDMVQQERLTTVTDWVVGGEHPIDNLFYSLGLGIGYGLIYAVAVRFLGFVPSLPSFLGIPILMFLFNLIGYNLRHSHVWLRWPGSWSIVFPSPAHHHVHHSCHPTHIDKNFAFMFPVWDVVFGTYFMPDDNRDVKFGVTEGDGEDLDGVFKLYWVPFRDAFRLFTRKKKNATAETLEPAEEQANAPTE